jgi:Spy/CpxP family protein refolding chaperone
MKKVMMVCAMVSLFAASGAVWAADGGDKGGPGPCGDDERSFGRGGGDISRLVRNEEAAKKLGVTDEQIAQLREMAYQGEIEQIKGHADLEIAHIELRRLMDSAKPTEEAVGKAVDKISALEAQLQKARFGEMLKARQILGEETMQKLRDAMRDQMRERGRDRDRSHRGDRHGERHPVNQGDDEPPPPQAPMAPPEMGDDGKDE